MSGIELEHLLGNISSDHPSGDDLEYDPAFQDLRDAIAGQPERQMGETVVPSVEPDWKLARSLAVDLLSRSKDLRIAVLLCQALLHTEGVRGLEKGLSLTRSFLADFWDSLFPQLDRDDDNDPTARVNALSDLCGRDTFLTPLRAATLVSSRVFGTVSLRDTEIADGKVPPPRDANRQPMDRAAIHAALQDCELEELRDSATSVTSALSRVKEMQQLVTEYVGAEDAPDLGPIADLLSDAAALLRPGLKEREDQAGVPAPPSLPDGATDAADTDGRQAPTSAHQISSDIKSREDVVRILDRLCDYYERFEPSSPVPLLLRRARHLVTKDFVDIIRDLAPEALAQIESIRGPDIDT